MMDSSMPRAEEGNGEMHNHHLKQNQEPFYDYNRFPQSNQQIPPQNNNAMAHHHQPIQSQEELKLNFRQGMNGNFKQYE